MRSMYWLFLFCILVPVGFTHALSCAGQSPTLYLLCEEGKCVEHFSIKHISTGNVCETKMAFGDVTLDQIKAVVDVQIPGVGKGLYVIEDVYRCATSETPERCIGAKLSIDTDPGFENRFILERERYERQIFFDTAVRYMFGIVYTLVSIYFLYYLLVKKWKKIRSTTEWQSKRKLLLIIQGARHVVLALGLLAVAIFCAALYMSPLWLFYVTIVGLVLLVAGLIEILVAFSKRVTLIIVSIFISIAVGLFLWSHFVTTYYVRFNDTYRFVRQECLGKEVFVTSSPLDWSDYTGVDEYTCYGITRDISEVAVPR